MEALDRIFAEMAAYNKEMGSLHHNYLELVNRDIDRFKEMTDEQYDQMNWQARLVLCFTALSGALAVAGAVIPKGSTPPSSSSSSSSNFAAKALKAVGDKLKDNDFLRETCKTASQTFQGITPAVNVWQQGKTTKIEAARELLRMLFQEDQQQKGVCSQEARKVQELALSILQSRAKGN